MTEIKIPKLFKTETININGHDVEIKGLRGNDYALTLLLDKIQNRIAVLSIKLNKLTKGKENDFDYSDEEFAEFLELKEKIEDIKEKEVRPLIEKLGQRGIKRAFYPDLNTDEIDKIPDNELDPITVRTVFNLMNQISYSSSKPSEEGDDTKKESSPSKKKSKTSES